MSKRTKLKPQDGLGPLELKKIRSALRQVWHRSHARRLAVKRCTDGEGYTVCEQCGMRTPKLKVDHVEPVGGIEGMIERLFCPSTLLQGLCNDCHKVKTKAERALLRSKEGNA